MGYCDRTPNTAKRSSSSRKSAVGAPTCASLKFNEYAGLNVIMLPSFYVLRTMIQFLEVFVCTRSTDNAAAEGRESWSDYAVAHNITHPLTTLTIHMIWIGPSHLRSTLYRTYLMSIHPSIPIAWPGFALFSYMRRIYFQTAAAQSEGGHQAFKYDHERRRQQAKRFLNHNSETNSSCVKFGWCDNPHCKRMVDGIDDNNSDVEESTTFSSGGSEEEFPEPDPSDPADGGLPCMARWRENPGREAMDLGWGYEDMAFFYIDYW